jgi:mannonate dehydratase
MTAKIKIGTHVRADAPDEELAFLRQLGIGHVRIHLPAETVDATAITRIRERFEKANLHICSLVHLLYQAPEIAFGLPGREALFARLAEVIRRMGREDIRTLEYDFFLYAPLPATGHTRTRGARTREFDLAAAAEFPPVIDHAYTPEEMWAHHAAMLAALLPVAEEAGVRLALHPDDPPTPELLGVPRIFGTAASLDRILDQFPSPNLGILFCVGTWAEGGASWGLGLLDAIRHFARRDRLFSVHFRNVSAPLPHFHETFLDNGCVDMGAVMHTLKSVGYDGLVIPDHCPELSGDKDGRAALAWAIGYMKGLLGT